MEFHAHNNTFSSFMLTLKLKAMYITLSDISDSIYDIHKTTQLTHPFPTICCIPLLYSQVHRFLSITCMMH